MSAKKEILVSIVIPCYNHGAYIQEALNSVEQNNLDDFYEIIIVNDGSTDEATIVKLKELEAQGYQVINQSNKGLSAARNAGISKATGKYILPLDADNKISPEYYREAMKIMDRDTSISIVYSDRYIFGKQDGIGLVGEFELEKLLPGNYIDACSVYRKEIWVETNGYDEKIPGGFYEDWEFWIACVEKGYQFKYLSKPLYSYREEGISLKSKALDAELRLQNVKFIVNKHKGIYKENYSTVIAKLHATISNWDRRSLIIEKQVEETIQRLNSEFEVERNSIQTKHTDEIDNLNRSHQAQLKILQAEISEHLLKVASLQAIIETLEEKNTAEVARVGQLKQEVDLMTRSGKELSKLIFQYEERIKSMESTKTWRFRQKYHKLRRILGFSQDNKKKSKGILKKIFYIFYKNGGRAIRKVLKKVFKTLYLWFEDLPVRIIYGSEKDVYVNSQDPYVIYQYRHALSEDELTKMAKDIEKFKYQPLISIILPVYNPPERFLYECLDSIIDQVYENIEICIADDCSTNPQIKKIIESYKKRDFRIKTIYRTENGHISACSNSALDLATGDYCVLVDHDDTITKDCVFELVKCINKTQADVIYSDEDKIDLDGKNVLPFFKSDWAPESFTTKNYLCHVSCIKKTLVDKVGGFRITYEGAQDYDLLLRVTEIAENIQHIPKILYHWRMHAESTAYEGSTKSYAYIAGQRALQDSLFRKNIRGTVEILPNYGGYCTHYEIMSKDKITIFIPTKNNADVLKTCIDSIYAKSTYTHFEIVVVSNNSDEPALFELLKNYQNNKSNFIWFELNEPFNFSKLMNACAEKASGEYYLLLNNDMEIITPNWMEGMLEQAQRKEIGAVGAKLLYPNDNVQHAGVVIGISGVAGHIFTGFHKTHYGYFGNLMGTTNYSAVTGACLMCRKEVYEQVNGFTEEFTVEYNDTDFCLKILEAGYRNVYLPHVELYHYESLTRGHPFATKSSYEKHLREVKLFKDTWQKYIDSDPYYNPNLSLKKSDYSIKL